MRSERHLRSIPRTAWPTARYRLEPRPNGNYAIAGLAPESVVKDHYWVRPETGDASNAIDFFVRVKGASFNEAMRLLTS